MMNYRLISKFLGYLCVGVACSMLPSAGWAIYFKEWRELGVFFASIVASFGVGGLFMVMGRRASSRLWQREALALVSSSWILASAIAAIPFVLDGVLSPVNAFFEAASGITTTGSTVIVDIEAVPRCLLFWRSQTQWMGGIGIVMMFISILPYLGAGGKMLFRSEASGPDPRALTPRMKDTASILYKIYGGITVAMTLVLMSAGMSLYDALCHTMAAISSGGFSPKQASVAAYDSLWIEVIVIVGMIMAASNFGLFFAVVRKDWLAPFRDAEWRAMIAIIAASIVLVTLNLMFAPSQTPPGADAPTTYSAGRALRVAAFQVVSIATCTGYTTDDFDYWPSLSRVLLIVLMFIGGSAGSTSGGIKVIRIVILAKAVYWRIESTFRPKTIRAIRLGDEVIDEDTRRSVSAFFTIYISVFVAGMLVMAALGLSFESALSAVATCMSNTGPGIDAVGASEDFSHVPALGRIVLSLLMIAGRVELFSMCVLLLPGFWRRK